MNCGLTSVTFRDKSVSEIIALAKEAGLSEIEWGADLHVKAGDVEGAKLVKRRCDEAAIRLPSYGSYYKGTAIADFIPILQSALILKTPLIRIWAGRIPPETITESEFSTLVEHLQDACDRALEEGITLALEYHRKSMTQSRQGALRLLKAVNRINLKTYWQPNPEVSFEEHLEEIKALAPYLVSFHVFNWDQDNTRYGLSENQGLKRWRAYLAQARLLGLTPNALLEFVKDDSSDAFRQDAQSLIQLAQKPKALLIGSPEELKRVYAQSVLDQIRVLYDLSEEIVTLGSWDESFELLQDAVVLFSTWGMLKIDEEALRLALPKLEAVFYAAGSVQAFAKPFLDQGITLCCAAQANAIPVAEMVASQIMLANKGFFQQSVAKSRAEFDFVRERANAFPGNKNVKVGLLGAGSVGRKVLAKLIDTDITVMVYDPYVDEGTLAALGAQKATLERIFSECQTISNHMPDLPSTKGNLNYALFRRMGSNTTFINTGRGATVNEADLLQALREKPNCVALLDVTHPEPPVQDSPLYTQTNLILTPHIAGSLGQEVIRLAETMALEATNYLLGRPCVTQVNVADLNIKA